MLGSNQHGYAVMSKDRTGIALEDYSLDYCKQCCRNGDIVVEVTPMVVGFNVRIWLSKNDREFRFSRTTRYLNLFGVNIQWGKEFGHRFGKEVWRSKKEIDTRPLAC